MIRYGVFSEREGSTRAAGMVDDRVFDLTGLFPPLFEEGTLDALLAAGHHVWRQVDDQLSTGFEYLPEIDPSAITMHLPCTIGDYVDFYSSIHHASNVGRILRRSPEPLTPNWRHLPIGYHGRSASVVIDGTPIRRPHGQLGPAEFGPTERLDFELEVGFITGNGPPGPISVGEAEQFIFGLVLVNDWSARDIQAWEYQPLGPFLGKSFATTISPWVVPLTALEPFRVDPPEQNPPPLPYLAPAGRSISLDLEVTVNKRVVTRSNFRYLYWTMSQQLAHASSNGARIRAGDLFASGTISGPEPGTLGCLLEITENGTNGSYLADGDEVVLHSNVLGSCSGTVVG